MSFEEMQTILAGVVASQAKIQESQAKAEEFQVVFRENMELMRQDIANTQAIANSNARAIEAAANEGSETQRMANKTQDQIAQTQTQLVELIRVVGQFAEATNSRLEAIENNSK